MDLKKSSFVLVIFLVHFVIVNGAESFPDNEVSFGIGKQTWNFANIRNGSHLFWWLHYTTASGINASTDRPLVIWLQGGPGFSSTGHGNFEDIGPVDIELNSRNYTWVKDVNVLFIDSPLGSGFSYVDEPKYLPTNNTQIAKDLVELMKHFLKQLPEFKSVPIHIFGESYGAKVGVEFAYLLYEETKNKGIECNLKSVNSIGGWISPIDAVESWAPYLYHLGFLHEVGLFEVTEMAEKTRQAVDNGQYEKARSLCRQTQKTILNHTVGVNFYNVLKLVEIDITKREYSGVDRELFLANIMTNLVRPTLNITSNVEFGSQSVQISTALVKEFMKPVTGVVEKLLNETSVEFNILSGQFDLITSTPGTIEWVLRLNWPHAETYLTSDRHPIIVNSVIEGYFKKHGNLGFYWINHSGHMVPVDNPNTMDWILRKITKYHEQKKN